MAAPVLPSEIVLAIALCDTAVFRTMLTLPPVAAAIRSTHMLNMIQKEFTMRETNAEYTHYTLCGRFHRDGDQPAIVRANGDRYWYWHGQQHRDGDQPAVVRANG